MINKNSSSSDQKTQQRAANDIAYRINEKKVSREEFENILSAQPKADWLKTIIEKQGYCVTRTQKGKTYENDFFYCAPPEVFKMEEVIELNEYDPLDGDAYNIAYALYKAGFGVKEK